MRFVVLLVGLSAAVPTQVNHVKGREVVSQNLVQSDSATAMITSAEVMEREVATLEQAIATISGVKEALNQGSAMLRRGLCNFAGFCRENPARGCQEIVSQPGLSKADLPDGQYWLTIDPAMLPEGTAQPPVERLNCVFDVEGNGWTVLFDDSVAQEVRQEVTSPLLRHLKFKEVLAYTPRMLIEGLAPVRQLVYFVDETKLETTGGRNIDEIKTFPWVGQDGWGAENDRGSRYPNSQQHYRWKYFGKIQQNDPYAGTLFMLDDGDVKEESCKTILDLNACNQDFYCTNINGTYAVAGKIPQTAFAGTRNGIISFGCSNSIDTFTQCGTCNYDGPDSDLTLKHTIMNSVVQKLLVR